MMIRIMQYGQTPNSEIFQRSAAAVNVEAAVASIIDDVRTRGDAALYEYAEKLDGAKLTGLQVTEEETEEALRQTDPGFLRILREAAENIRAFHKKQIRNGFVMDGHSGCLMGQKVTPIEKVGLYVPGGRAAYPSTVLMDSIPAKIAGCEKIVITTPPGQDGRIHPSILAAASVAGVDAVYKVGGAQAIAALAYGTETIPAVYKIVGPGNAYVAEAKKQVFGRVSIDMIAGPSEILVVADEKSNPAYVAADMLSQAEHDPMASAVLICDSMTLAGRVAEEIERQVKRLPRREIAEASIRDGGKIIVAENIQTAIDVANEIAPEHLELCLDNPFEYLGQVRNAGSVFLGRYCPEALGDYLAGPNHTLPTSGTAKFSSPLSVDDFVKKVQFTYFTRNGLESVYRDVAAFAEKEGLTAHAESARIRFRGNEQ